ncbi:MAG: basic amino acid/polyamine antiporter, family [Solirubrobacteraceae bacterium]|jgi:APA family basic amino acid/polyamine antiporter|nr:basic amino acid/polyamine antiporter, family [Solirubrobacteraceae bacterium]
MLRRGVGSPTLFAIIWSSLASAVYFSLGIVAEHAIGLTPLVFLGAGVFFVLTAMTYVEGASLHPDRAGSTVFARHAFNELWSFVAAWAVLLDFLILIAVTAFAATNYVAALWAPLGEGTPELALALAIVAYVAIANIRAIGDSVRRERVTVLVLGDIALQMLVIVVGAVLVVDVPALTKTIDLGTAPRWEDLLFALTISAVAFTSLEGVAGLAGEVEVAPRGLERLIASATASVIVIYVGISLVAVAALPITPGRGPLTGDALDAPVIAVVETFTPGWLSQAFVYATAGLATLTLVVGAHAAMLGLSRLAYSLATNRQIPSALGRLHPRFGTPYVVIVVAAVLSAALVVPGDLDFLVGIYAFGAMLAFLIAHVSICVLRYREPDLPRPYRIPLSVGVGGAQLPLPAVLGAVMAAGGLASLLAFHAGARVVGVVWMVAGVAIYVTYRRRAALPVFRRVVVSEKALRSEPVRAEYGSILVPILGTPLDDDIVQTAGRLAAAEDRDDPGSAGATIEAIWVFEVPLSLPLDARLPDSQLKRARAALARAKAVGEEYEGVEVATATVRARRAGEGIVAEADRRGVELIVLAAEEPSRIRGGARLGGIGGPLDNFVGDATKYVVRKAACRVLLTAPADAGGAAERAPVA